MSVNFTESHSPSQLLLVVDAVVSVVLIQRVAHHVFASGQTWASHVPKSCWLLLGLKPGTKEHFLHWFLSFSFRIFTFPFFSRRRSRGRWRKECKICWWSIISSAGTLTGKHSNNQPNPLLRVCIFVFTFHSFKDGPSYVSCDSRDSADSVGHISAFDNGNILILTPRLLSSQWPSVRAPRCTQTSVWSVMNQCRRVMLHLKSSTPVAHFSFNHWGEKHSVSQPRSSPG